MSLPVATIKTRPDEEVRLALRTGNGRTLIEIQTYSTATPFDNDPLPTRKGLVFSPELFPSLKKAVGALEDALTRDRLLDPQAPDQSGVTSRR